MRQVADSEKIKCFMKELGQRCRSPGRVYLTGGASALLVGWRDSTADIDIKLDPEPAGAFEAIALSACRRGDVAGGSQPRGDRVS